VDKKKNYNPKKLQDKKKIQSHVPLDVHTHTHTHTHTHIV